VRLVENIDMVSQQIKQNNTTNSYQWDVQFELMCEEYIDGLEIIVNTVSRDGLHRVSEMYTSHKFICNGYIY